MKTIELSRYDYDGLQTCPFCDWCGNLTGDRSDNCTHFIAAFETLGSFAHGVCPPVTCDGHIFRRRLIEFLEEVSEVVAKITPRTGRHPEIHAYYHPRPAFVTELRMSFKIEPELGETCGTCGERMRLVDDDGISACVYCGC